MPRVCPQAAYERSTFPGLGPPENLDPAEARRPPRPPRAVLQPCSGYRTGTAAQPSLTHGECRR